MCGAIAASNVGEKFIAGGVGGVLAAVVTNPFDVLRSRLMSVKSQSLRQELVYLVKSGRRGLFAGLNITLLAVFPTRGLYFAAIETGKQLAPSVGCHSHLARTVFGAFFGALLVNIVFNPIYVVRTHMQLNKSTGAPPPRALPTLVQLYRRCGVRGLYAGLTASIIGIGETVTYWSMYETLKFRLRATPHPGSHAGPEVGPSSQVVVVASATSKLVATLLWYPHEVLRLRLRESAVGGTVPGPLLGYLKSMVAGGPRVMWAGIGVHVLRQVPSQVLVFVGYEGALRLFNRWRIYQEKIKGAAH